MVKPQQLRFFLNEFKMAAVHVQVPALQPPPPKQLKIRKGFLDIAALEEQELAYNQWVSLGLAGDVVWTMDSVVCAWTLGAYSAANIEPLTACNLH